MKRVAFKMKLKAGCRDEYRRRHDALWPELRAMLKAQGVSEYSIFYDEETGILFAFQKVEGGSSSQDMGNVEIVKKWWSYMADIMDANPDDSPVTVSLDELFYLP
jgi:L-rhamnose mutarotase